MAFHHVNCLADGSHEIFSLVLILIEQHNLKMLCVFFKTFF